MDNVGIVGGETSMIAEVQQTEETEVHRVNKPVAKTLTPKREKAKESSTTGPSSEIAISKDLEGIEGISADVSTISQPTIDINYEYQNVSVVEGVCIKPVLHQSAAQVESPFLDCCSVSQADKLEDIGTLSVQSQQTEKANIQSTPGLEALTAPSDDGVLIQREFDTPELHKANVGAIPQAMAQISTIESQEYGQDCASSLPSTAHTEKRKTSVVDQTTFEVIHSKGVEETLDIRPQIIQEQTAMVTLGEQEDAMGTCAEIVVVDKKEPSVVQQAAFAMESSQVPFETNEQISFGEVEVADTSRDNKQYASVSLEDKRHSNAFVAGHVQEADEASFDLEKYQTSLESLDATVLETHGQAESIANLPNLAAKSDIKIPFIKAEGETMAVTDVQNVEVTGTLRNFDLNKDKAITKHESKSSILVTAQDDFEEALQTGTGKEISKENIIGTLESREQELVVPSTLTVNQPRESVSTEMPRYDEEPKIPLDVQWEAEQFQGEDMKQTHQTQDKALVSSIATTQNTVESTEQCKQLDVFPVMSVKAKLTLLATLEGKSVEEVHKLSKTENMGPTSLSDTQTAMVEVVQNICNARKISWHELPEQCEQFMQKESPETSKIGPRSAENDSFTMEELFTFIKSIPTSEDDYPDIDWIHPDQSTIPEVAQSCAVQQVEFVEPAPVFGDDRVEVSVDAPTIVKDAINKAKVTKTIRVEVPLLGEDDVESLEAGDHDRGASPEAVCNALTMLVHKVRSGVSVTEIETGVSEGTIELPDNFEQSKAFTTINNAISIAICENVDFEDASQEFKGDKKLDSSLNAFLSTVEKVPLECDFEFVLGSATFTDKSMHEADIAKTSVLSSSDCMAVSIKKVQVLLQFTTLLIVATNFRYLRKC